MTETDSSQKTEEPTARRLEKAREEGQIPRSREVSNWLILSGATLVIALFSTTIASALLDELVPLIERTHTILTTPAELIERARSIAFVILSVILLPCILIGLTSVLANVAQHGFLITTKPITPKIERLSLLQGLKRIFSREQMFEFGKGILKIVIVGAAGLITLIPDLRGTDQLIQTDTHMLGDVITTMLVKVLTVMLVVYLLIAIADAFFQQFSHRRRLRMSRSEVKEEQKQMEGDPQIRARVRQIRMERHRHRLTEGMKRADVVVTNPTHYSVALEYKMDVMEAPVVVAKGQDHRALLIRRLAEEAAIPLIEDPPLARTLFAISEEGQAIAPEQYEAVAAVISKLYRNRARQ